jgi:hypothetical protein
VEAILTIIRLMASTPHGSWAACAHFGIRDFFEQARALPELPRRAVEEANLALQDLGIVDYRIEKISKEQQNEPDIDSYVVTLTGPGEAKRALKLTS